jgi:alanine dehydrogenase
MEISCAMEIMKDESRVALRPNNLGVGELLDSGANTVRIEKSAGKRSGFPDAEYQRAGALLMEREQAWEESDLIVKVKQPLEEEFAYLKKGSILLCFLHSADNVPLVNELLRKHITAIGYETIQLENGYIPILAAMSKIAGRVAYFDGAKLLLRHRGMMIGPNSTVAIIGLGNAGTAAAELIVSANPKMLYLFDKNPASFEPLRRFYQQLSPYDLWFVQHDNDSPNHQRQLASILAKTDLVIAATHIPGEKQKKIVPEWMEKTMKPGAVLVDISIDQGGAFESSKYHKRTGKQIFKKNGVWHYCVPNIPGRVPADSTPALTRETFPYIAELAEKGFEQAVRENPALARGVNTHKGWITHEGLARSIGRMKDYKPLMEVL